MEEHNSSLSPHESAQAHSAAALRDLQHRAHAVLASSRERAARLESQITQQLDALDAALNEQIALDSKSAAAADASQAEIARLTAELEDSRAAWLVERVELESQAVALAQQLDVANVERDDLACRLSTAEASQTDLSQKLTELEAEREVLIGRVAKLTAHSDDVSPKLASLEAERDELYSQLTGLETEKATLAKKLADLETQTGQLSEKLADSAAKSKELTQKLTSAESVRDDLAQKLTEFESQHADLRQKLSQLEAHSDDLSPRVVSLEAERNDLAKRITELESQRDALSLKAAGLEAERDELAESTSSSEVVHDELTKKVTDLEQERDELAAKTATLESQIQASQADWRKQLLDFENRLCEQQAAWNEQRTESAKSRTAIESERDELQQKFELALEDLQRLRGKVTELEQDLSRRPEASEADSAELVALRAERAELAARVAELEQRPAEAADANSEQQLADLQRRFELAVEDLREYKTKCGKLESQLAAASTRPASSAPDTGGNDWESQKRRLLASLEEGAEGHETPVEKQQRITIEGTIEMTDAVVAEKDRQIAELQAQLAGGEISAPTETEQSRQINELIDADEIIAEHRKRHRELELELEEKLRAAELELSIERAKMARQKAELEDLKSELDSKQQQFDSSGGAPAAGQPKRRWRDKLGLGGDEK
jgi:chromosome segregation ATPase